MGWTIKINLAFAAFLTALTAAALVYLREPDCTLTASCLYLF